LSSLRASKGSTDDLADKADAVVVAQVQSGQQTGHTVAFVLSISRTIKGDLAPGSVINVSGSAGMPLNRTFQGQYGLWFLQKAGGSWALLPLIQKNLLLEASGYVPLPKTGSPAAVSTPSPPATVYDRVAVEPSGRARGLHGSPADLFDSARPRNSLKNG
jgi:hypothetical protein